MKRSKTKSKKKNNIHKKVKTQRTGKDRKSNVTRRRKSADDAAKPTKPAFRIEDCLRDSYGFPHIEQGCRDQFQCMVENYQQWATRYIHAVRLALLIPGIETYQPPLDMMMRFWDHIMDFDVRKPHTVLGIALERLDALHVLNHLPGGRDFERAELPYYVRRRMRTLERNKVIEAALTCIDVLVIAKYRDGLPIDWKKVKIDLLPKLKLTR